MVVKDFPDPQDLLPSYPLTVTATDSGTPPLHSSVEFTLVVIDSNKTPPVFSQQEYIASLNPVLPIGSRVEQVKATDHDETGNPTGLTYSIEDNLNWFHIDPVSGLITTISLLDCHVEPSPRFSVLATDSGSPPMIATATVEIIFETNNQNQPLFDQSFYNSSVDEDIDLDASVLKVSDF